MDTYTRFSRDIFAASIAMDRDGPVAMLNLIRLHTIAQYADGRVATGRKAYEAYSRLSAPAFTAAGGTITWRGHFELTMVGPEAERWDIAFVAQYPSVAAFTGLFSNPVYREAMSHRQAAVADSRLIRFGALPNGTTFSGCAAI